MTADEIIKLKEAGFSSDEIRSFMRADNEASEKKMECIPRDTESDVPERNPVQTEQPEKNLSVSAMLNEIVN